MTPTEQVFYKMLVIGIPILLTLLAFIGGLAVKALIKMSIDLNKIKVTIEGISKQHDGLSKRVDHLEERVYA